MSQSISSVKNDSQREKTVSAQRKRRKEPPMRLDWPGGRVDAPQMLEKKKPRRVTFVAAHSATRKMSDTELWTVRYAPTSSSRLAVAPKKVQEIRDWMQRHIDYKEQQLVKPLNGSHPPLPPPLLVLVGSPGIGKSASVKCLADELAIELMEWTEGLMTTGDLTSSHSGERTLIGMQSPLNAFEQFLNQCGSALQPLGTYAIGPLDGVSNSSQGTTNSGRKHRLLLIDELPYTHTPDAQRALQSLLTRHVQSRSIPTILILGDAPEGKVRTEDLERYLHPQILIPSPLTGPWCLVIAMHPPTKIKFRKAIQEIMASESAAASASASFVDELHERCGGDIRFAISTLQFEMIGDTFGGLHQTNARQKHPRQQQRDSKLSPFHALGKLLYAKRQPNTTSSPICERPPLEFDPDTVIRQSDMELGNILHFLSFHCVDFYTDLKEVGTAMSYFSDVATLCDHAAASGSSATSSSLMDVASAMSCRIVAHTNAHPAPFSFRPLGAPKVYEVLRKRQSNQERIRRRCHHYHSSVDGGTFDHRVNDRIFAADLMPFLQVIAPSHEWIAYLHLDSHLQKTAMTSQSQDDDEDMELWKEQLEILKEDDIVEDIDDDDGW